MNDHIFQGSGYGGYALGLCNVSRGFRREKNAQNGFLHIYYA